MNLKSIFTKHKDKPQPPTEDKSKKLLDIVFIIETIIQQNMEKARQDAQWLQDQRYQQQFSHFDPEEIV